MHDSYQTACGALHLMGQAITPLIFPFSSVPGKATCASKNCSGMDILLAKLHRAMSVQTSMANTGVVVCLYLRHLPHKVPEGSGDSSAVEELQRASLCLSCDEGAGRGRQRFSIFLGF